MKQLQKTRVFVEKLLKRRIRNEYDAIIPVVGNEGVGKSTFMTHLTSHYLDARGMDVTPETVLDTVVWGERDAFADAMVEADNRDVITVMDAGRVLYRKEAMVGEQREIEKDLLDVRTKELVILLGFQDWNIIPSMLQQRRACNAFFIPRRGVVHGYGRDTLDKWAADDERPDPDFRDRFPALDGTETWEAFKQRDRKEKERRITREEAEEEEDEKTDPREVAQQIKESGVESVISIHGGHNKPYIDPDMIELEQPDLTVREAKKVKKLLERDPDVVVGDKSSRKVSSGA